MDPAQDRPILAASVIQSKLQKLVALRHSKAFFYFHRPEIRLAEGVEVHHILEQRLHPDLGEIDFLFLPYRLQTLRFHRREQNHISDAGAVCNQHNYTVYADSQASGRRKSDLQRVDKIHIHRVRLVVYARIPFSLLFCKALILVDRIVQLGESVRDFPAVDIRLKTAGDAGILRISLGQRRNLHRMTDHEYRTIQISRHILTVTLEHLRNDFATISKCSGFLFIHAVVNSRLNRILVGLNFIKVNARDLLHSVCHVQPLPGRRHIEFLALICQNRSAVHCHLSLVHDLLRHIHRGFHITVGHIAFHRCEFRIVIPVHAFVAEHMTHLVNTVQSADDQPLQIKLVGDAHIQIDVKGVVMSDKRPCVGSAGNRRQDRRVHLHVTVVLFQHPFDLVYDLCSLDKSVANLRVHNQIHISLTIAKIRVLQSVPLVRQYLQGFAQQYKAGHVNGDFIRLGLEHPALHSYDVTDVISLEPFIFLCTDVISLNIALNPALLILHVKECGLAHHALAHDPARDGHLLVLHSVEIIFDVHAVSGDIPGFLQKRIPPRLL